MTLFRTVLLTSGLVLVLSSEAAQAQPSAQDTPASRAASEPMVTLQMPALPAPVSVTLNNILNQRNGNMTNQTLKPDAPTLSRTDMITFQ
jgi:hypothetical protein